MAALCALGGAPAWAQSGSATGQDIYTCVDKTGRTITSDRLIADCTDREQRVLAPDGAERRRISPAPTEAQRAAMEAQRRKELEAKARADEERRRERVLLVRYPTEAAHQRERQNALAQVDQVIEVANKRLAELTEERKRIDADLEFYRRDPSKAPETLRSQIVDNDQAVQEQQRFIATQEQEKRRINQRFDAELARLRQLWAPRPETGQPPPETGAAVDAPPQ